ncbi:MAG: M1 family aminopeptidase, partial [Gammaproteobacteria bacterium]|nr:M1 family aminopeptidase [Gammaproteobacteria bacterium]
MFREVFTFELRHQLRSPLFVIVASVFFVLAYFAMASEDVTVGGGTANLDLNAAFAIVQTHFVFSIIAMFAAVAFASQPITRDYEYRTAELFMVTQVDRLSFLGGRFLAVYLVTLAATSAAVLGTLVATFMPWLDPERIGEFAWAPYEFSLWAVMMPNVFIVCGLFFALAALTRTNMAAYVGAVALIALYVVVGVNTDQETISTTAVLDPFGAIAFAEVTRYWTVFDKNARVPEFGGTLLYSRALWTSATALLLGLAYSTYRFSIEPGRLFRRRRRPSEDDGTPPAGLVSIPRTKPVFGFSTRMLQLGYQLVLETKAVLRSVPFMVILLFGVLNTLAVLLGSIAQLYGTPVLPATGLMVQRIGNAFLLMVVIIIAYYAAELLHRDRQSRMDEIVDALPFPSWVMVAAKTLAMVIVIAVMLSAAVATAIGVQLAYGYTHVALEVYLIGVFVLQGWNLVLLIPVAFFLQALIDRKYPAMLAFVVVVVGLQVMSGAGFQHRLYQLGLPGGLYSGMNGWGHFLTPSFYYGAYWTVFGLMLGVGAHLLWRRGKDESVRIRLAEVRARLTPGAITALGACLVAMLGLGGWIFYNTNVLNEYRSRDDVERLQADYEKRYRQYEALPMPEVVDADVEVDIFPAERRIESRGKLVLENVRDAPLDELHLNVATALNINALEVERAELFADDDEHGYYRFRFDEPLRPGERVQLRFDLSWTHRGFVNHGSSTRVVHNGTFVNNTEIMPIPGYNFSVQLGDNNKRRKYGLPPVERLPAFGDEASYGVSQFRVRTPMSFRAVVSTSEDQTAVAPGYLQKQWISNGRRYFEYAMDRPIWPFVSFMSARYAVTESTWNDVALQVFHHPTHDYNVASMMRGAKASLDYFTTEFSPYQYRQFRILEFPRYQPFAQSFPNTIPFSESIGFLADLSDETDIDYVFYVTAHELAHQWWGHQVVGARMQGMTMIVETLAQYFALMVMEKEYGRAQMRRFLKYELDRYLAGRGGELIEELPLMLVENQPYIHYRKGSLVLYALKDYIGEDAVNRALRRFIEEYAFQGAPFPDTGALVELFRDEAGPEHQALIDDLFEKIVLYDLKVAEADVTRTDDER